MAEEETLTMENEFVGLNFNSVRLAKRFIRTMETLAAKPDKSIWTCSEDRAEAKAIYRMLSNDKLDTDEIMRVHCKQTYKRMAASGKTILKVQDTSSLNYNSQKNVEGLGYFCEQSRGLNIHSCLAVTTEGLTLGLLYQMHYSRKTPKDHTPESEKRKRDFEDKESYRWAKTFIESNEGTPEGVKTITLCDREGDIYEFIDLIAGKGELFLIRITHDRLTVDNKHILDEIRKAKCEGTVQIMVPRDSRKNKKEREATIQIRYKHFEVKRPDDLKKNTSLKPSIGIWVVHALEENPPKGEDPIEWFLMTNEPIEDFNAAFERIKYYTHRWKIERFHFVLKTGCCEIEKNQARSVDVKKILILMYSVIAVFILNLTYLGRILPNLLCDLIFEETEWKVLYCVANKTKEPPKEPYTIAEAVKYIGWLGGPKRAPSDGPPGVKTIWMGLETLHIILTHREYSGSG